MKTLLLMRHAKSSWKDSKLADHDRPLNKRGKNDAPRMGALMLDMGLVPDLIIASTAKRACKTAEAVASACDCRKRVRLEPCLYGAGVATYVKLLKGLGDEAARVLMVGHNPDIELVLDHLTGINEPMPTAALAHIELPVKHWAEMPDGIQGELAGTWLPREVL